MDITAEIFEIQQGMVAAWNKAQEFYEANLDERGVLKKDIAWIHTYLLDRVEQYNNQLARLEHAVKVLQEVKALEAAL
jgi:hypothetical protein